jgi:hypothetical protein
LKDAKILIDKCLEDRRVEADSKGSLERGRERVRREGGRDSDFFEKWNRVNYQ